MSNAFFSSAATTATRQPGISSAGLDSILRELFSRVVYAVSTLSGYYIFNNMSRQLRGSGPRLMGLFLTGALYLSCAPVLICQTSSFPGLSSVGSVVNSEVERAKENLEQVERLAADGTLPRVKVEEARSRLADAEDEAVLTRTLYGLRTPGSMTEAEGNEMLAAAQRRMERARVAFEDRERLLASGAIARVDVESASRELDDRKRILGFAEDRLRL